MSLENAIATATQEVGLARQEILGLVNVAQTQVGVVGAAYANRLASMQTVVFVNQMTGVDTNPGTAASPIKTISRALAMTPPGGICNCYLQAAYNVDAALAIDNRILNLTSDTGVRHNLTFERYSDNLGTVYRGARAFYVGPSGHLNLRGLTVVVPSLDGGWTVMAAYNSGLVNWQGGNHWGAVSVGVTECNWQVPASPFCSLFPSGGIYVLQFHGNTLNGAVTTMNGQVVMGVTNTAGTAVSGLPYILTNLTNI